MKARHNRLRQDYGSPEPSSALLPLKQPSKVREFLGCSQQGPKSTSCPTQSGSFVGSTFRWKAATVIQVCLVGLHGPSPSQTCGGSDWHASRASNLRPLEVRSPTGAHTWCGGCRCSPPTRSWIAPFPGGSLARRCTNHLAASTGVRCRKSYHYKNNLRENKHI